MIDNEDISELRKKANELDRLAELQRIRALNTDNSIYFNFSYSALKMLGKNLYSNPSAAISELVANGIDAKAEDIYVYIDLADKKNSTIEILDNGTGMDYADLAEKYVWIGRNKREDESDELEKDSLMGRKGIGKLAALYLTGQYYIFTKKEADTFDNKWVLNVKAYKDSEFPKLDRLRYSKNIDNEAIWKEFKHGTVIRLEKVDLRRTGAKRIEGLKRVLADFFLLDGLTTKIWVAVRNRPNQDIVYEQVRKNIAYKNFYAMFNNSDFDIESKMQESIAFSWLSQYEHIKKEHRETCLLDSSKFITSGEDWFHTDDEILIKKRYKLVGWIGIHSTIESKHAVDPLYVRNDVYQPNRLRIYVRKKLAVANYFDMRKSTQTMADYIEGEISFDILDDDDLPDIATSSRQDFLEDERVEKLISIVDPIVYALFKKRNTIGQIIRKENDEYTNYLKEIERKKREEEEAARKKAEEAAKKAEAERAEAEARAREALERAEAEKKRSQYILSVSSIDDKNVMNAIHSIYNKATRIKENIDDLINISAFPKEGIKYMEKISLSNQYILYLSKPISKAGYVIENNDGNKTVNITKFIKEYLTNVLSVAYSEDMNFDLCGDLDSVYNIKIKPLSFVMVIENIIGNAIKANANNMLVEVQSSESDYFVYFKDNGDGISSKFNDVDHLFNFGVTTTSGSGLGLYYARKYIKDIKGTIQLKQNQDKGASVILHWNK